MPGAFPERLGENGADRRSSPGAAASSRAAAAAALPPTPRLAGEGELAAFERECIELFVHAAQVLSIPRSVGEIYGYLYASPEPVAMDTIMERLEMSKGSVSQGLKWLRDIGAVRAQYVSGDRRDHYVAITELRKLASGFLQDRIVPHLRSGEDYLSRLSEHTDEIGGAYRKFAHERYSKLRGWHRIASRVVPLFLRVTGRI